VFVREKFSSILIPKRHRHRLSFREREKVSEISSMLIS